MFDWNRNGKRDADDGFMDFMVFNQIMNGGKKAKEKQDSSQPDWIDELEELDAMDDEDIV